MISFASRPRSASPSRSPASQSVPAPSVPHAVSASSVPNLAPASSAAETSSRTSTDNKTSSRALSKHIPALPIDYHAAFRIHLNEFNRFFVDYLAKGVADVHPAALSSFRTNARQKLMRLTLQQFYELSTDVYDELVRRQMRNEVPFLPPKDEFHPNRNRARRKLETLPILRFLDLSGDVCREVARR